MKVQWIETLEKRYINTLFHEQTDSLWNMIKTIHYTPKNIEKSGNHLVSISSYTGPPGTGKSTFAYRVAMATKRHIINVKISKYNRIELINLFNKPQIRMTTYSPKHVIYVLDEFDVDLDHLSYRQNGRKRQTELANEVIVNTMKMWTSMPKTDETSGLRRRLGFRL